MVLLAALFAALLVPDPAPSSGALRFCDRGRGRDRRARRPSPARRRSFPPARSAASSRSTVPPPSSRSPASSRIRTGSSACRSPCATRSSRKPGRKASAPTPSPTAFAARAGGRPGEWTGTQSFRRRRSRAARDSDAVPRAPGRAPDGCLAALERGRRRAHAGQSARIRREDRRGDVRSPRGGRARRGRLGARIDPAGRSARTRSACRSRSITPRCSPPPAGPRSAGDAAVRLKGKLVLRLKGGDVAVPLDLSGRLSGGS